MFRVKRETTKLRGYIKVGVAPSYTLEEVWVYLVFGFIRFPLWNYYKIPYVVPKPVKDKAPQYLQRKYLVTKELPPGSIIER